MVKIAVGLVFLAEVEQADEIIKEIQQTFDIDLLHVETSFQKLWIIKGAKEENNE
jgi:hypothetical protein